MTEPILYKDAGVDIDKAETFVQSIRTMVRSTYRTGVLGDIGGFGGLFHLDVNKYRDPVLVSATDGVGTKIKIAILMDRHNTIGIDLVAMCVNDVIVHGAAPLFFLDYLAMGQLAPGVATQIVEGITTGCRQAHCSLIGGETAEMPGMYQPGDYDLAGFVVGVVERDHLLDGSDIAVGHRLIGLASNGLHSNGYSLVRRIVEANRLGWGVAAPFAPDETLGRALMTPTRIYVKSLLALHRAGLLKAAAHITGGGLPGNVPRVLPGGTRAVIDKAWRVPAVFTWLARAGGVEPAEMLRVFNCGIGMVVVTADPDAAEASLRAAGETVFRLGQIEAGEAEASVRIDLPDNWLGA